MVHRIILALCALVLMSGPGEAASRLSAAELRALAPGVYVGSWKGKLQLHLTLKQNGTVSGTVNGRYHAGKWYVSGQNLCLVFRILVFEKTKCGAISRQGPWLVGYYNKKGKPRIRLKAA
jgi:hypothetical protein